MAVVVVSLDLGVNDRLYLVGVVRAQRQKAEVVTKESKGVMV